MWGIRPLEGVATFENEIDACCSRGTPVRHVVALPSRSFIPGSPHGNSVDEDASLLGVLPQAEVLGNDWR
jgi:hypothetical protein